MGTPTLSIPLYRGYTHGEFALPQSSWIASIVGNWCRRHLAGHEFNKRFKRWELKKMYCFYDQRTQHLHIPISFCDDIVDLLTSNGAEVRELKIPDYEPRKIDIKMLPHFTDRPWQVDLIKNCSNPNPGMYCLSMQTGKGKTYSAIRSALNLGYATIIVVDGLVDQWIDVGSSSVLKCTDCKREDLYRIQGFKSLGNLMMAPNYMPKIFVASLTTMQLFASGRNEYDCLPLNYAQFFARYGIGTKIVDEAHMNFHANLMMDLRSNVPHNLYCSATFTQTDREVREIFNRVFPRSIQFGRDAYDKYVKVFFVNFSGSVLEKHCMRARGYSHVKYEESIMHSERKFQDHIDTMFTPIINEHFVDRFKPGNKMLIFCASIEFITRAADALTKIYPNFRIGTYIGNDKQEELSKYDIVLTTSGKGGTGLDLPGLTAAYNTISLQSSVLGPQMLGRLRRIEGEEVRFIDRCDINIPAQLRHAEIRKLMLKEMSSNFTEVNGVGNACEPIKVTRTL